MDELQILLDAAREAKKQGISDETINFNIYTYSDGKFKSVSELTKAIAAAEKPHRGVAGFARAVGEGATFSLWDEAAGAIAAIVPGGMGYREARDVSRGRYEPYRTDHPYLAGAGEMVGGAILPGVGAGAGAARAGAGLGTRVLGGMIGGAIGGGTAGALTGAGQAEEMADVPKQALMGGAIGTAGGAAVGAGLPIAGAIARPVAQRVGAVVAPEMTARWISRDMLRRSFRELGMGEADVIRALRELPEGSVVADLDPSLARAARRAVNESAGLERVGGPVEAVGQRHGARGERLAEDLGRGTRSLRGGEEMLADAERMIERARAGGYEVLERNWNTTSERRIREVIDANPDLADFARRAVPGYAEGRPLGFREAQDILIDARRGATANVEMPAAGRRLSDAAGELEAALETVSPGFLRTQRTYAAAMHMESAYPRGKQSWGKSLTDLRVLTRDMMPEELEAFRIGMLDYVEESLRKSEAGSPMAGQLLRGRDLLERLRATFNTDAGFEQFRTALQRERRWELTWNRLSGNSTTAQQSNDMLQGGLSLRGVLGEIFDPGEVRSQGMRQAGEQLLSPSGNYVPPAMEPGAFARILQMANPMLRGAASGQAAVRGADALGNKQMPF